MRTASQSIQCRTALTLIAARNEKDPWERSTSARDSCNVFFRYVVPVARLIFKKRRLGCRVDLRSRLLLSEHRTFLDLVAETAAGRVVTAARCIRRMPYRFSIGRSAAKSGRRPVESAGLTETAVTPRDASDATNMRWRPLKIQYYFPAVYFRAEFAAL
jgi:hypothetical protein